MQPVINQLIQIQELMLIREEQKVAGIGQHLNQLDTSIKTMVGKLPADVKDLFARLQKKEHIVIVPVADNACGGCRMRLPISQMQTIRMAKAIHTCPNCARILYAPQQTMKRTSKTPRRTAPRKIGISRFSSSSLMVPHVETTDREEIIRLLATRMEDNGYINSADMLIDKALDREAIVPTGLEHGLAVPHARGVEGGGLALSLATSKEGINWGSDDGKPSQIIFFVAIPTAASAFYLKLLAGLAETFAVADKRRQVMAESDPEKLWKTLCKVTRAHVK